MKSFIVHVIKIDVIINVDKFNVVRIKYMHEIKILSLHVFDNSLLYFVRICYKLSGSY